MALPYMNLTIGHIIMAMNHVLYKHPGWLQLEATVLPSVWRHL